ncbi:MAG: flavin reductase family protein [Flavipsychrobacter sp.]
MNKLFRKLLLGYSNPRKYPAIRVRNIEIEERVFLHHDGEKFDITANHSVICERPFCIAIFLPKEQHDIALTDIEITVGHKNKIAAELQLTLKDSIKENETYIFIYEIEEVRNYQINNIRQYLLMRHFLREKKLTQKEGNIYAALYSYPREVVIISYEEDGYYNLFPMDFRHYYNQGNLYFFGLRTTNITLEKILRSRKLVVCSTDAAKLQDIYYLGKHHSSAPPEKEDMPFELTKSELYNFPVPGFSTSYKEVEIVNSKAIGSHVLMIGKVVNSKSIKADETPICHIHFFEYLKTGYKQLE